MDPTFPVQAFSIQHIPVVLYGSPSQQVWLFVHGKFGCKEEGAAFAQLVCPQGGQVLALDLPESGTRKAEPGFDPWHVVPELRLVMDYLQQHWPHISLRANSIGTWFSMEALSAAPMEKALFVSPLVDMEQLIYGRMALAHINCSELQRAGEIPVPGEEPLSWAYLHYAQSHPIITWDPPTAILYPGQDSLTPHHQIENFARRFSCQLTVWGPGEHWFHTPPQLAVLRDWEASHLT